MAVQLPASKREWLNKSKSALIKAGERLHPLWDAYKLQDTDALWLLARGMDQSISAKLVAGKEDVSLEALVKTLHTWLAIQDDAAHWDKGTSSKGEMSDSMRAAASKAAAVDGLVIEKLREVSSGSMRSLLSEDVWTMSLERRWLALKTYESAVQKALEQELKDGVLALKEQHQK